MKFVLFLSCNMGEQNVLGTRMIRKEDKRNHKKTHVTKKEKERGHEVEKVCCNYFKHSKLVVQVATIKKSTSVHLKGVQDFKYQPTRTKQQRKKREKKMISSSEVYLFT